MKTIAIGLIGPVLDAGKNEQRWNRWRPSVALFQHEDLLLHRFEMIYQKTYETLARLLKADIALVSPETEVNLHAVEIKNPWDFEEVYTALDGFARQYPFRTDEEEYLVHHILVKTEAEANKIIASLNKKNVKFEDQAKKYSQDPGSAKNGGALDWADRGAYVKEFSDAMVALKKGETTQKPVKTQFGYHVIRLDDTRMPKLPPLDAVRGEIVKQLQQQRVREAIAEVRAGAKIE